MRSMVNRLTAAWLIASLGGVAAGALAQGTTTVYDEQAKLVKSDGQVEPLKGDLLGDRISLYSGALEFVQSDFDLRGNNDLPVGVGRRFVAGQARTETEGSVTTGHFGDWDLEIPRLSGSFATGSGNYGWAAGMASPTDRYLRCTYFGEPPDGKPLKGASIWPAYEYWAGNFLYVPGQGSEEIVWRTPANATRPAAGTWNLVTKSGWQLGCLPALAGGGSGEGFVALSPAGITYRFNWMVSRALPNLQKSRTISNDALRRAEVWLLPTSATDRFGNVVTYVYNPAAPWQLTEIRSPDGRVARFTYLQDGSNFVQTASHGTRTWTYTYSGKRLSRVTRPDGSTWDFDLGPLVLAPVYVPDLYPDCNLPGTIGASPRLGTIKHPSGAVGTFYTDNRIHGRARVPKTCTTTDGYDVRYSFYPRYFATRAVVAKTLTGPGLPAAGYRWDYDYPVAQASWSDCPTCVERKVVSVTDPSGAVTRHTFGTWFGVNDGQLLKVEEAWSGTAGLRTIDYRYRAADAGPYPSFIGTSDNFRGDALQCCRLSPQDQRTTAVQGATFAWGASTFDALGRPTAVTRTSSLGFARTETTLFHDNLSYWVLGQIATVTAAGVAAPMEHHDYDAMARRTQSKQFELVQAQFAYNTDGTLAGVFDAVGHLTQFANRKRGVPQSLSHPDGASESAVVDDHGDIVSLTNGAGTVTTYAYDPMGRLASVVYPSESGLAYHPTNLSFQTVGSTEYGLGAGHWKQVVTTGAARTERLFDALWRLRMSRTWDTSDPAGTRRVTVRRFDHDNRVTFDSQSSRDIASVDSAVPGTTWTFDPLGHEVLRAQDSELGTLTTATTYLSNFQRRVTGPRGHATTYAYAAFDVPDDGLVTAVALPQGVSVAIGRDSVLALTRTITRSGLFGGANVSAVRRYVYDANQRLCKTIEPENGSTVLAFDSAGNVAWRASGLSLTSTTSCQQTSVGASSRINFAYDVRNRLSVETHGDGSPGSSRSYTGDGLLGQVTTTDGSAWSYGYNNRRLLTAETLVVGGTSYAVAYAPDAYGNRSSVRLPGWPDIAYAPNALGQPTVVAGYASGVSYHPNGAIAGYTLANGISHSLSLTMRGQPGQWRDTGVVNDLYSYDADGNPTAIVDQQEGGLTSRAMAYDGLDRLVSASGIWGAGSFAYDPLDNLRSSVVGPRSLTHVFSATKNRLTSLSGSMSLAFGYDVRGNLTSRGSQGFSFDIANRMKAATGKASYAYDGHGRRVTVSHADGSVARHVYTQAGQLVYSSHPTQGTTRYVHLGTRLIAENNSLTGTRFVHSDALGSPVAKTNLNGLLLSRTRYEPYGATAAGTVPSPIGFTGHANDADTALVYMQQRYYDPVAGRFLSVDPIVTNASNGNLFNRYAYVENDPYRFTDPTGEYPEGIDKLSELVIGPYGKLADNAFSTGNFLAGAGYTLAGAAFGAGNILGLGYGVAASRLGAAGAVKIGAAAGTGTGPIFQRVVANAELKATQETGLLRGGRSGENFFTNAASLDAKRAQQRLGLDGPLRDQRIEFRITSETAVSGPRIAGGGRSGTSGGGRELSTSEPTTIEILRIDSLRR